ncbi:NAD-dependent epimerase/dehydratase family protein [Flavobacterium lacisediminis]|uniref:NAD(P)-dependent oxidoreductase n=1 Tax=Flavobacterium lacisediminis TaxID=2989705 RepID=A0ABT3EJS3_9FLAO|nr:NAD(P)-dependent oxidoreductase [Flavobacterium lacisediminis]MCW1148826.1 NAD(P)-dependent oxidoreductase [Flavobacterium lacisediminis]
MNKRSVIITGANGFIGSALVDYFCNKGMHVKAFVRRLPTLPKERVEYCLYSLEKTPNEVYFESVDYFIHCAFVKHDVDKNSDAINLKGTSLLLKLCRKHNVKMVFISSFSAHSEAMSHYGKNKFECEKIFNLSTDVVIKPGLVLGDCGFASEVISFVKKSNVIPLIGGGKQPLQTLHINDLCLAIDVIMENAYCGLFSIAETHVLTMKSFYKEIGAILNKKIFFIPVPFSIVFWITRSFELLKLKLPISSESLLGLKYLISIDTTKDVRLLGFFPRSYRDSLQLILKK